MLVGQFRMSELLYILHRTTYLEFRIKKGENDIVNKSFYIMFVFNYTVLCAGPLMPHI